MILPHLKLMQGLWAFAGSMEKARLTCWMPFIIAALPKAILQAAISLILVLEKKGSGWKRILKMEQVHRK